MLGRHGFFICARHMPCSCSFQVMEIDMSVATFCISHELLPGALRTSRLCQILSGEQVPVHCCCLNLQSPLWPIGTLQEHIIEPEVEHGRCTRPPNETCLLLEVLLFHSAWVSCLEARFHDHLERSQETCALSCRLMHHSHCHPRPFLTTAAACPDHRQPSSTTTPARQLRLI